MLTHNFKGLVDSSRVSKHFCEKEKNVTKFTCKNKLYMYQCKIEKNNYVKYEYTKTFSDTPKIFSMPSLSHLVPRFCDACPSLTKACKKIICLKSWNLFFWWKYMYNADAEKPTWHSLFPTKWKSPLLYRENNRSRVKYRPTVLSGMWYGVTTTPK